MDFPFPQPHDLPETSGSASHGDGLKRDPGLHAVDSETQLDRLLLPETARPSVPRQRSHKPLGGVPVSVIGAGPVGCWTALLFAHAGATVRLYDDGLLNTGYVNAGWGFAYHSPDPAAGPLAARGIELYRRLRGSFLPSGVVTEEWSTVQRASAGAPLPDGLDLLDGYRQLAPDELYMNMVEGVTVRSVVVPGQLLLAALADMHRELGVQLVNEHVSHPEDIPDAAFVINATGLASAWIYDDHEFAPSMGTVVRVRKPEGFSGVHAWDDGTNNAPYAISQEATGYVVVGGTTTPVSIQKARRWVEAGCPADIPMGERLLEQIHRYLPELAEAEYVRTDTGIRPERRRILLAHDPDDARVIHATGFGGFGVTVAPAVALRVVDMAIALVQS